MAPPPTRAPPREARAHVVPPAPAPPPRPRRVRRARACCGRGGMFVARSIAADHRDLIHDVSFDFHGRRMATCSSDQSVKVSGEPPGLALGECGGAGRARPTGLRGGAGRSRGLGPREIPAGVGPWGRKAFAHGTRCVCVCVCADACKHGDSAFHALLRQGKHSRVLCLQPCRLFCSFS